MKLINLPNYLLGLLFPTTCLGCSRPGEIICYDCLDQIPPSLDESTEIKARFAYSNDLIRHSIHKFKFGGKFAMHRALAMHLSELIVEDLAETLEFESFAQPIVIPIPMTRKKVRERGYNQAELLARTIAKILGYEFNKKALIKNRETFSQVSQKSRTGRLHNLSNSFSVSDSGLVYGRNIILIDDVHTTGATITLARRTLEEAGANKVRAYTLAH